MAKKEYSKALNVSKTKKIHGVSLEGLSMRQMDTMSKHSKHHTKKHIQFMVDAIKKGSSFSDSHKMAMAKVGK